MSFRKHLRLAVATTLLFSSVLYLLAPALRLSESIPMCFALGSSYNIVNVIFFSFIFGTFVSETRMGHSPPVALVSLVAALKLPLLCGLLWWLSGFGADCAFAGAVGIVGFLPIVVGFEMFSTQEQEELQTGCRK